MFLAIDIGNTSTSLGFFEGDTLSATLAFPTLKNVKDIPSDISAKIASYSVEAITIASVVPQAIYQTADSMSTFFPKVKIKTLSHDDVPIKNFYKDPEQVGTDRLLGSLAAYQKFAQSKPLIVIDFGTATVFDCINKKGEYLGGAISLGIESSAKFLSSIAAQLPDIPLEFPKSVLGRSTKESMQSGILFGAIASTEGLVERLRLEVFEAEKPTVVATGGLSRLLKDHTKIFDHIEPDLVLYGIRIASTEKDK